jgi:TldD protein
VQKRFYANVLSGILLLVSFSPSIVHAQTKDSLLLILKAELNREMDQFKKAEVPPYYIDYQVHHFSSGNITADLGSLTYSQIDQARFLTSSVRLGDYQFDNTHQLEDFNMGDYGDYSEGGDLRENGFLPFAE